MLDMPYFMNDARWYEFDFDKRMFVLTDEAPKEAKDSYDKWENERKHFAE